ncbi:hypothetical protein ACN0IJ_00480 [Shewanella indica]|uniref:hypothetical protein n=1 Tax=Shewanella TaxID=22 RepID=UPI00057B4C54|nr:hypothetical protein [Shewanella sp. ECSMB14102]OIN11201.1 hypothetical protein BFS86_14500 [Shewanella algae]
MTLRYTTWLLGGLLWHGQLHAGIQLLEDPDIATVTELAIDWQRQTGNNDFALGLNQAVFGGELALELQTDNRDAPWDRHESRGWQLGYKQPLATNGLSQVQTQALALELGRHHRDGWQGHALVSSDLPIATQGFFVRNNLGLSLESGEGPAMIFGLGAGFKVQQHTLLFENQYLGQGDYGYQLLWQNQPNARWQWQLGYGNQYGGGARQFGAGLQLFFS